jgi:DUF1009 family protein
MSGDKRLALVAGSGALPLRTIAAAREAGWTVRVLTLNPRPDLAHENPFQLKITRPDLGIKEIRAFGATHICAVGGMHMGDHERETLAAFAGDVAKENKGDSKLSQLGAQLLKILGIPFIGVHEIVTDLLAGEGMLGTVAADQYLETAMRHAFTISRRVGEFDLGQAIVMSGARIVATEDIAGTDALLERVRSFRATGLIGDGSARLVLAKSSKPGQPLHIDLPAIGPDTVRAAAAAGIAGIVVESGHTLIIEREAVIAAADQAGIVLMGLRASDA